MPEISNNKYSNLCRYIDRFYDIISEYLTFPEYNNIYKRYLEEQLNEDEFKKELNDIISKAESPFKKRAAVFEMKGERVEELLDDVRNDLLYQFEHWADGGFLREIELDIMKLAEDDNVENKKSLLMLQDHISRIGGLNSIFMGELILRKLEDKSTREEKRLLDGLNRLEAFLNDPSEDFDEHSIIEGAYNDSNRRIGIMLMDKGDWDDLYSFLQHEFTHCLLHETFFSDMLNGFDFVLRNYRTDEELREIGQVEDNIIARNKFFSLYNILDESFAYLSERFTGRHYSPGMICDSYSERLDPDEFRSIYELLGEATEYMSQESFDIFAKKVCKVFSDSWNEGSSTRDYYNTVATIRGMIDIKI